MHRSAVEPASEMLALKERLQALEEELTECRRDLATARQGQEEWAFFLDGAQDYACVGFDADLKIRQWSRGAERVFGYGKDEVLGEPGGLLFTPEDRACGADQEERQTAERAGKAEDERWHIRKDGTRFWASGILAAHYEDGCLRAFSKVLRDLTLRKLAEDRLRASEEQFRLFVENVGDYALVPLNKQGRISGWNPGAERIFGYSSGEIVGHSTERLFLREDAERGDSERDLAESVLHGRNEDERWMVRKDGSRFWARWVTTPMYDNKGEIRGYAKVLRDETAKKRQEDQLSASLQEKEVLIREIHHRVKNNLQVITSLVSLQAGQVNDGPTQRIFEELEDRVRAIALLHEAIYQSPNVANIPFGSYIEHVLRDLVSVHQIDSKQVQIHVESDEVTLSIEQAIPLGLIVNELASNALKHAFAGRDQGRIAVSIRKATDGKEPSSPTCRGFCELRVQDDGPGFIRPEQFRTGTSMGLRITRLLTKQLRGFLQLLDGPGTQIAVRFPLDNGDGYAENGH